MKFCPLSLQSTIEFCASPWLDLGLSLVLADSWLACLPWWVGCLLSAGSELVEEIVSELSSWWKKIGEFSVLSFMTWCIAAKCGWSSMNNKKLVLNVAENWHRQWTTTDLIQCHPPWPGSCQSWYVLTVSFTPQCHTDRDWTRETA